jgi:hypothetical protein
MCFLPLTGPAAAPASSKASTSATPTPSPPPGPERYLADVRAAGLSDRDIASASDKLLLHIGSVLCDALDSGVGYAGQPSLHGQASHDLG